MLRKLLLILFVCNWAVAKASYGNMSLAQLFCNVNYGAVGKIVKVDNIYFYLKVDKYVLNKLELDTIPILKFHDWDCAWRFEPYKVGQKELVFFSKTNSVIDIYDFIGYGMGDEFEMPIFSDSIGYRVANKMFLKFGLNEFLEAVKGLDKMKKEGRIGSPDMTRPPWKTFAERSTMHRYFIGSCYDEDRNYYDIDGQAPAVNPVGNFFENCDNKVFIRKNQRDSIIVSAKGAKVRKMSYSYVITPGKGVRSIKISVYSYRAGQRKLLVEKSYLVRKVSTPCIYFGSSSKDTIEVYNHRDAIPEARFCSDDSNRDEAIKYKLLAYNYELISGDKHETFVLKSVAGGYDLVERLQHLETNDRIILSNIYVLYPNNEAKRLPDRAVVVKQMKKTKIEIIHK